MFYSRQLDRIERLLRGIVRRLDFDALLENEQMATVAEVKSRVDSLVNSVRANTDATSAVTELVTGLKAQVADLTQQLANAISNGANAEELQAVLDALGTLQSELDADTAAEAALTNTEVAEEPEE